MDKTFTLKQIKKSISQHNKDMDNDIKIRIKGDEIKFSSAKAESMLLQERMKNPPKQTKEPPKKKTPDMKGQQKLTEMMTKK